MSPIPIKKIPISLQKDTPTKVSPEDLKAELNAIGLYCQETNVENLRKHIDDTLKLFPDGKVKGFGIFEYNPPSMEELWEKGYTTKPLSEIVNPLSDIHSNWEPSDIVPFRDELSAVGYPSHFDYLLDKYIGFSGVKSSESYSKEGTTVDAIKEQFTKIAINISSTLIEDLDKDQLEATFNKIISTLDPGSKDYDSGLKNRGIFLVSGYAQEQCDAIGILNVEYRLVVTNYKDKKSSSTNYQLDVTVRTMMYTDVDMLDNHYNFVLAHFKSNLFFDLKIPVKPEIKIYDALPAENSDTFRHSLPLEQTEDNTISAMVLYAPDLQNIGCIDNTDSDGSAQYSKTTTSGFTFSSGQKISIGAKYAAGVLFQKAEMNVNLEISFTEQWNESQSETTSFSVPARSKAFLYQGYLQCAVLEYNLETFKYSYKQTGTFLSNIIKTSSVPLDTKPAIMVVKEDKADNAELPLWESL